MCLAWNCDACCSSARYRTTQLDSDVLAEVMIKLDWSRKCGCKSVSMDASGEMVAVTCNHPAGFECMTTGIICVPSACPGRQCTAGAQQPGVTCSLEHCQRCMPATLLPGEHRAFWQWLPPTVLQECCVCRGQSRNPTAHTMCGRGQLGAARAGQCPPAQSPSLSEICSGMAFMHQITFHWVIEHEHGFDLHQ